MSHAGASRIANYLTTGYFNDAGYPAASFDKQTGDVLRVYADFTTGADRGIVRLALDAWSAVSGLRFAMNGTANNHDLRLTDSDVGAYSYGYRSNNNTLLWSVANVGRDWLNAYGSETVSYYTQTWIHEIGHALGLGHAGNYNGSARWGDQNFALDSWQMSVMSYFAPFENPNVSASYGYVLTPMPADILAIHRLYGTPKVEKRGDVYGFDGTATGIYEQFGDLLDNRSDLQPVLLTIHDTGGIDMLNMSRDWHDQRIDLQPGAFSDVLGWHGTLGIAYGTVIENARGGSGDDVILGNRAANRLAGSGGADTLHGGNDSDNLDGGSGNDRLYGQLGADLLIGDNGADFLDGGPNSDILRGGSGNDRMLAGTGSDRLRGQSGNDLLWGHAGDDIIWGDHGDDSLSGGGGNDSLRGGRGTDIMSGNAGADVFVFRSQDIRRGDVDLIRDFTRSQDLLDLRNLGLDDFRRGRGSLEDGVLRAVERNDKLHLFADLDGDGVSDLHIVLADDRPLSDGDLLF